MKDQIQDIIARFGPRPAGSAAEKKAQEYIASLWQPLSDTVQIQPFQSQLTAKFGKMKWYALGYILSLILFFFAPWSAWVLAIINATVLVSDLMRNDGIADFLFPLKTSWNVTATLEPQSEVRSTLVFSGHIDSTNECTWWYRLGKNGAHFTLLAGLLIALLPVVFSGFLLSTYALPSSVAFWHYVYFGFVALSPVMIIYFSFHGDIVVDGACDNLSGVIIAKNVVEHFADKNNKGKSTLAHTRLRFISFGSEEKGLRGSTAYIKANLNELKEEKANLVNIDSVRLPEEVSIITGEAMSFVKFDSNLIDKTAAAFDALHIPFKKGAIPMGATDAIPFQKNGIPALSIIGMSMKSLDPTYHTRLDVIENVDQRSLDNVKSALIELVKRWDA